MNKRIISLLLCLLMLTSFVMSGCSSGTEGALEGIAEDAAKDAITLTMYLLAEKPVSAEQEAKIETAVNKITKANFKIALDLRYFTADEYYTKLEAALSAEDGKAATDTEEIMVINPQTGIPEIQYPIPGANQADIFYLGGFDKVNQYKNQKWLKDITSQLAGDAAILNDYIAPQYLQYSQELCAGLYFVPNNVVAGEYTYLLLNKDVLEKLNYTSTSGFTSLTCDNVKDVLDNVSKYYSEYRPLYSATNELDVLNVNYFGFDDNGKLLGDFSVVGGSYDPKSAYMATGNYYKTNSIFDDTQFADQLTALMEYKFNGYYGDENDSEKPFAVGFVKGNAELKKIYGEEYEMVPVAKPMLSTDQLFGNGFAVSSFVSSKDTSRAVEIITYLNTNVAFRNLLLYGIEGENYQLIESNEVDKYGEKYKYVKILNDDYSMALETTGNTLLAYPKEGEYLDIREYQKLQNKDMIIRLDLGFYFDYLSTKPKPQKVNMNLVKLVREYSAEVYDRIEACQSMEEYVELLRTLKKEVNEKEFVTLMKSISYNAERNDYEKMKAIYGEGCAFGFVYMTWLEDTGLYVEVE